jgi:hypothetical protein
VSLNLLKRKKAKVNVFLEMWRMSGICVLNYVLSKIKTIMEMDLEILCKTVKIKTGLLLPVLV